MIHVAAPITEVENEYLLRVNQVSKLFGGDQRAAARDAAAGLTRDELLERHNSFAAVANATFDVKAGEIFVIMGLSGSGKSTLLRCINRLIEPTSGAVEFAGEDILKFTEDRLRQLRLSKISMVFQHFALLPHKTVVENVAFGLKILGIAKPQRLARAKELLAQVGLAGWERRYPQDLSGGMKQRVGLARSLAVNPDLLLMDEAFSALDPVIRREMQTELIQLQKQLKKTVIFITHDIQEALLLGDRIAMMKDGRIVQIGRPADLILRPQSNFVKDFTQDADRGRMLKAIDVALPIEIQRDPLPDAVFKIIGGDELSTMGYQVVTGGKEDRDPQFDFQTAAPDDCLDAVLDTCRKDTPILIVSRENTVLGVLDRNRLLDALRGTRDDN
jgi:glycine betaine/proline transport system ATP-binding protein